ncbi:MAG: glycosyltransferase family 4 protein [Candidatus Tectomicrobia bacterium]|uniref:Glycosyltransferase family 4 protein n=1 Tax=Tectimicrobiota bacterium TaxID=2528274 RepID=A0A932GT40_UNCTE|nr:glycosyltransferase family 4 protein [Candidatus Tectomicrobia bacterium]
MSRPIIIYIGQIKHRKGFDLLARAMPAILQKFPRASFLFISQSLEGRGELDSINRAQGTGERCFLFTQVDDRNKFLILSFADALVQPTRYEGFGISVIEGMACRCPVVSTRIPVIDEIIEHEQNGLLASPNDFASVAANVLRLLEEDNLRRSVVANASATVMARYTRDQITRQLVEVYDDLVQSKPSDPRRGKRPGP